MIDSSRPDVLVVGAGIAGLTTALSLLRAGLSVSVCDAGEPGGESTWAGGGIVSPVPPWGYPRAVDNLVTRSRALYPELIERVQVESGLDCEYRRCGLLLLQPSEAPAADWLRRSSAPAAWGRAGDFEPNLADGQSPALHLPDICQLRNPRLARALVVTLQRQRVPITGRTPVRRLWMQGPVVLGVETESGRRLGADIVVLACGAWTDRILWDSGLSTLGIAPVRGQMVLYRPESALLRGIVHNGSHYLIPRADHRILCGSTVERSGFDRRPTRQGFHALTAAAGELLPALAGQSPEAQWAGLRPGIAGDIPAIGPYAGATRLWINAGHYRNGLGMAPAAAELLAGELAGGPVSRTFLPVPRNQPPELEPTAGATS